MQEENKGDKIRRVLQLYAKLSDGYVINKAEEAAYYGVTERSITRDIDDIRNFLDEDSERTGIVNNVVYDRMAKGYRLETLYKIRLQNSEVLALCKILLDSRAFTKNEMVSMLDKLITCCVPKVNQKRVKELIQNEEFHYVEPKHGNEFIDLMWDLGQAINESRYIEIDYLRTKDKAIVHRRLQPVAIMFSEYYFYLTAFIEDEEVRKDFDVINDSFPTIYRIDRIKNMSVGNVFHMNHTENTKVSLSKKSLASHTFITGSTGSGKSNTVYHMLDRARKQGVKFLVVEPAKGEYKNVFGGRKDVTVLGTNPKLSQLLRINPFSFPENIHVLEHMDRLVEIFNVCWPMYAAMPAVLKNAVEKSYVDCGWDIVKSENKYGEELYPSFADVARNVKEIIDSSEYDAENKGAYKGSLLTRLQSLCNGINGMIFVADEIPKEQLFEENVIVDLSRVGSSETKSLIMGMMVLKLQEYRMSSATGMNAELNHITVLEEAHNLLRRTSNEQSAEGSNLLGKSVEMLSNAIAEMRTYGEGFIIADQAPGLMDMSVIRNTNTKIILRLPDQADRELVGRAANLNEDQITELAKLPCGVAAVYQNEWIQPVLCKVDLFAAPEKPFMFDPDDNDLDNYCKTEVEESLLNCIMEKEILRRGNKTDLKALKSKIIKSKLETCVKRDFMEYLEHDGENAIETLRKLIYDFLSAENAIIEAKQCNDIVEWTRTVVDRLNPSLRAYPNKQIDLALALILYEQTLRDASYGSVFCKFTEVYKNEGGVF